VHLNITTLKVPTQKRTKTVSLQNLLSKMPSTRGGHYIDDDGYEVELNKSKPFQQRDFSRRTTSKLSSSSRENSRHGGPIDMGGPIDLDEIFDQAWSLPRATKTVPPPSTRPLWNLKSVGISATPTSICSTRMPR
jgi:hypothetical protein